MSLADDSAESTKLRYCHKKKAGNYECVKKQQMDRKGQIKSKVNNLNVIFNRIRNVQSAFKAFHNVTLYYVMSIQNLA